MSKKRLKGVAAWLVTWEAFGDHARPPKHVVAVFNPRWSSNRIQQQVELLYVQLTFSLPEQLLYAKSRTFNPYPSRLTCPHGIPFSDYIACGHNPFLYARLVNNLRMDGDSGEEAALRWDERPLPENIAELQHTLGISRTD